MEQGDKRDDTMAFVDKNSGECVVSELDLHALPPTQTSIFKTTFLGIETKNSLTDGSNINFTIGKSQEYTDLTENYLQLECEVLKSDGNALAATDVVAPVNNFGHSLFKDVQVSMGGYKVSGNTETYAVRAYLEALLNSDKLTKDTVMMTQGWFKDTAGKFEALTDENKGFEAREKIIKNGRFHLMFRLHFDLAHQPKFLPGETEINITLKRTDPSFSLLSDGSEHKIKIHKAKLYVRRATINEEVVKTHEEAVIAEGPFKYPVNRVELTTYAIPAGNRGHTYTHSNTGQLPKHMVICFLDHEGFNGDYKKNPFELQHCNVSSLQVIVNDQKVPNDAYTPDFSKKDAVREYLALHTETGMYEGRRSCDISYDEFLNGYTVFPLDLTPDRSHDGCRVNLIRMGQLRVELSFRAALQRTTTVLLYMVYDNIIELTRDRHPITDYHMN